MSKSQNLQSWYAKCFLVCLVLTLTCTATKQARARQQTRLTHPVVLTQLPRATEAERAGPRANGMLRADYGDRGRLVLLQPDLSIRVMTEDFHSACDPSVSFDGTRLLFAAKRNASDPWHIFEMGADGSGVRRVTNGPEDHRSPGYQPTFYTIVSPKPWYQLTYVQTEKDALNEMGTGADTNLYSCKVDGSAARRLTHNLSSDMDPHIMPNGRLLLASWQRANLGRGPAGRIRLFGVNTDGADYAAFCGDRGERIKHMPCATTQGLVVFVEGDRVPWDGAGTLGCVPIRRPLQDYRPITGKNDGLFHSPSPLPDGHLLVSRRSQNGQDTHGLFKLNPKNGQRQLIFDSPEYHEIQAKMIVQRPEPDGRSSVVTEEDPHGKLYCLNVNISNFKDKSWWPKGIAKRLRVLEGIAPTQATAKGNRLTQLAQRRILGEIDLSQDGSFNITVPGSVPVELQILDARGMALQSCAWIWAKNHEPRGCIGCHEDGELTPENLFVDAVKRKSTELTLAPERRRTVDFRRDVMPVIADKCAKCHDTAEAPIRLTGAANQDYKTLLAPGAAPGLGKYVHPGQARTSPVIWHLFGQNTSRPWDTQALGKNIPRMPANNSVALTESEKRTFVEWIDMGAAWDGIPEASSDN